jgi:hypothetical protein
MCVESFSADSCFKNLSFMVFLQIIFEFRKWSFKIKPNDTLTTSVFTQLEAVKSIT